MFAFKSRKTESYIRDISTLTTATTIYARYTDCFSYHNFQQSSYLSFFTIRILGGTLVTRISLGKFNWNARRKGWWNRDAQCFPRRNWTLSYPIAQTSRDIYFQAWEIFIAFRSSGSGKQSGNLSRRLFRRCGTKLHSMVNGRKWRRAVCPHTLPTPPRPKCTL